MSADGSEEMDVNPGAEPAADSRATLPAVDAVHHLRLGWGLVLVFLVLGGVLEALHGFKVVPSEIGFDSLTM